MRFPRFASPAAAALLSCVGGAPAFCADAAHPTVVELFQSQGCSSCPPANASLIEYSTRADVLALNFAVDYWDRLGWKDTFSKAEWTQRQYDYAHAMHGSGVYTPQIVVNGRAAGVGDGVSEMEALAHKTDRGASGPQVTIEGGEAVIGAGSAPSRGADVWVALYDPHTVEVAVPRGENAGRTLAHKNIVHRLVLIGHWSGEAARFPLPAGEGFARAVLVQSAGTGPILAAAKG